MRCLRTAEHTMSVMTGERPEESDRSDDQSGMDSGSAGGGSSESTDGSMESGSDEMDDSSGSEENAGMDDKSENDHSKMDDRMDIFSTMSCG